MVEVFKTNVCELYQAEMLLDKMRQQFNEYHVNFDLEDCDKILRVEHALKEPVKVLMVMDLIKELGFSIELLPDDIN